MGGVLEERAEEEEEAGVVGSGEGEEPIHRRSSMEGAVRLLTTGRDGWSCCSRPVEEEGEGEEKKKARTGPGKNNMTTTTATQSKQVKRRLRP